MRVPRSIIQYLTVFLSVVLVPMSAMAEDLSAEELRAALANPARAEAEQARDEGRKPADVLAYLGLEKGMTILDVAASGGWYTEVLSLAVGDKGKVYAQNAPAFLLYRDGFYDKAIAAKLKLPHLGNVERLDAEFADMGIDGKIDLAITALNFHDVYNRSPEAGIAMLEGIKKALKPGGVLGLIDHEGIADADNSALHRMQSKDAIEAAKKAGFEVDVSNILQMDADDHTQMVFAEGTRGKTDRFLLKLTKPKM